MQIAILTNSEPVVLQKYNIIYKKYKFFSQTGIAS